MRVLMVGPWRNVAMRRHIDWATKNGMDVCVAEFRPPDHVAVPSDFQLAELLPRRPQAIGQPHIHKTGARAVAIGGLRLRRIAEAFQPHVVHSYMLGVYTEMCLQAGLRPLVASAWGSLNGLMTTGATAKDKRWLRSMRKQAAVLLVENPNLAQALGRIAGPSLRVECFPIGVDGQVFHPGYPEKVEAWRLVLDLPPDAIVLLSPRGWSPLYRQHHIMQAFAQAYHQLGGKLILILVGLGRQKNPEAYAQQVLDLGASLGVAHAIRWVPQVPHLDMPGLYALADIVVNYPASDAFPSTLLEAAACARPVITSTLPAYRNTFVEAYCRLVEPENPDLLAEAMIEVAGSHLDSWRARAQRARAVVLDEYDETKQMRRLMALYDQLGSSGRPMIDGKKRGFLPTADKTHKKLDT